MAVMSVPPGSRVLDLGTADGSVARALTDRACTVWGIECDALTAAAASQVCDRVIVADLDTPDAFDALAGETFDVLLALDVLEHLRDPTAVLRRAAAHLAPKGIAVVSIPNITHGALRISLLEGRFSYTDDGLLDRTHLRFFDRRSAERLMTEAGLTIAQNLRVRRELHETEIAVSKDRLSPDVIDSLAADPDATTYQFVFVAGLTGGLSASSRGEMLAERLFAENDSLRQRYRELETRMKSLEAERTAQLEAGDIKCQRDELRQELERRTQEAHRLHADFKQSKAEVVLKDAFISELRQHLDSLSKQHKKLSAKFDQLAAERAGLLARQDSLETTVRELRVYVHSAGFRIVEGVIRRLRSFPLVYKTTRAMVRRIARQGRTVE